MGNQQEGSLAEGDSLVEEDSLAEVDILGIQELLEVDNLGLPEVDIEGQHRQGSLVQPGSLGAEDRQGHPDNPEEDMSLGKEPEGKPGLGEAGESELHTAEVGKQEEPCLDSLRGQDRLLGQAERKPLEHHQQLDP